MVLLHTGLDMSGQKLYWTKNNPTKIESINFDGTALNTHYEATGSASWSGLEVDFANQKMYWYDQYESVIMRANLDGTAPTVLVTDVTNANLSLDLVNHKLYWTSTIYGDDFSFYGVIEKANLDGSERTALYTGTPYHDFYDLEIDATHQKMYWHDATTYTTDRANMDGTNSETFLDVGYGQMVIDEANSKLYFPSLNGDGIESINLDGSNRTVLASGSFVSSAHALALDKINNKIYYWDAFNSQIKRINIDGTGNEVWRNNVQNIAGFVIPIPDAVPASITSNPSDTIICAGGTTTFSITASNATGYQWQVNSGSGFTDISNGGVYSGAATATLTITGATSGMSGYGYRCVVTGGVGPAVTSSGVALTVNSAPSFYVNPHPSGICETDSTIFTSGAYYTSGYQWQVDSGSGYVNVSDGNGPTGGSYSGATSSSLSINDATTDMSGYSYRCIASGTCSPDATSSSVSLTVYASVTYYEDFDGDGYGNG